MSLRRYAEGRRAVEEEGYVSEEGRVVEAGTGGALNQGSPFGFLHSLVC